MLNQMIHTALHRPWGPLCFAYVFLELGFQKWYDHFLYHLAKLLIQPIFFLNVYHHCAVTSQSAAQEFTLMNIS